MDWEDITELYPRVSTKFTRRETLERVSRLECRPNACSSERALKIDEINSIDTGIDYKHPTLGGGFGPGHLVSGGYDFVGDAYTGKKLLLRPFHQS
jgi:hypothetical protein